MDVTKYGKYCVNEINFLRNCTDICVIYDTLRQYQVNVSNPLAITPFEAYQFEMVSLLIYVGMKRVRELMG